MYGGRESRGKGESRGVLVSIFLVLGFGFWGLKFNPHTHCVCDSEEIHNAMGLWFPKKIKRKIGKGGT